MGEQQDLLESYSPPVCVWRLVKEHVTATELPQVRALLGEVLTDLCSELLSEVEMWLQIWREIRCCRGRKSDPLPRRTLAEPPVVKELLREEIRLLLLNLRKKARCEGRDETEVLSSCNPKVVKYAIGGGLHSAPKLLDEQISARASSSLSCSSSSEADFESLKEKLNVKSIEEIVVHLQSVLTEECEVLKREIQYLQACVMHEQDNIRDKLMPEPTLSELKEERRHLERELQELPTVSHPAKETSGQTDTQLKGRLCGRTAFLPVPPAGKKPDTKEQSSSQRLRKLHTSNLVHPT